MDERIRKLNKELNNDEEARKIIAIVRNVIKPLIDDNDSGGDFISGIIMTTHLILTAASKIAAKTGREREIYQGICDKVRDTEMPEDIKNTLLIGLLDYKEEE